jgi:hypothetical protein
MGTHKLIKKIEDFFDQSRQKQIKKRDKLAEFIDKLEEKKTTLEQQIINESEHDQTSLKYRELDKKFKAVCKLLKRAKQQNHALVEEES